MLIFKYMVQWALVNLHGCATITTTLEHFRYSERFCRASLQPPRPAQGCHPLLLLSPFPLSRNSAQTHTVLAFVSDLLLWSIHLCIWKEEQERETQRCLPSTSIAPVACHRLNHWSRKPRFPSRPGTCWQELRCLECHLLLSRHMSRVPDQRQRRQGLQTSPPKWDEAPREAAESPAPPGLTLALTSFLQRSVVKIQLCY